MLSYFGGMNMSSEPKKDLLPFILVTCGPKDDGTIRLMATDGGEGMQIFRHAVSQASNEHWAERTCATLEGVVDSRTLQFLKEHDRHLVGLLQEGKGSIWLAPNGLRLRTLKSSS